MKIRFCLFLLALGILFSPLSAQITFSDSLQISLMTIAPGPDAYECFGHSGIRIKDQKNDVDVVFHYGVYNYSEPHFIWHFIQGKCNYYMGGCYTRTFLQEYRVRQLNVTEQVLALDSAQSQNMVRALLENFKPQNRNYRYNFFFDNCATRPFTMINQCADIQYDTTWTSPITLRQMVREMTGSGNWLDFGITLAIAKRADQPTSFQEQMFLPKYLCQALDHASYQGQGLVSHKEIIDNGKPDSSADSPLSPLLVSFLLCIFGSGLTLYWNSSKDHAFLANTLLQIFDSFWLLATGCAGCIIWFLNFFSEHPAVDNNLNCLWLLPTNLLFIAFIWIKKAKKVRHIYFFIIFAAEIAYVCGVMVTNQAVHPAFVPVLAIMALRALTVITKKQ